MRAVKVGTLHQFPIKRKQAGASPTHHLCVLEYYKHIEKTRQRAGGWAQAKIEQ